MRATARERSAWSSSELPPTPGALALADAVLGSLDELTVQLLGAADG